MICGSDSAELGSLFSDARQALNTMSSTERHCANKGSDMDVQRVAAFTRDGQGGNPAGIALCDALPEDHVMQMMAARIGYSETVFATPLDTGYRVRYFAPQVEVPFCGHATIALGAALARKEGSGSFALRSNAWAVRVDGVFEKGRMSATLHSPPRGIPWGQR